MIPTELMLKTRQSDYDCKAFAAEVWSHIHGATHVDPLKILRHTNRVDKPQTPCIVVMSQFGLDPHCGILIKEGVLHLSNVSPEIVSLNRLCKQYTYIRFYV